MWRVVIYFTYNGLSLMSERGVISSNPGDALNAALASVRADRADTWRALTERAESLALFSHEASALPLVGGHGETVRDAFERVSRDTRGRAR